jgi:hypothetical protein
MVNEEIPSTNTLEPGSTESNAAQVTTNQAVAIPLETEHADTHVPLKETAYSGREPGATPNIGTYSL